MLRDHRATALEVRNPQLIVSVHTQCPRRGKRNTPHWPTRGLVQHVNAIEAAVGNEEVASPPLHREPGDTTVRNIGRIDDTRVFPPIPGPKRHAGWKDHLGVIADSRSEHEPLACVIGVLASPIDVVPVGGHVEYRRAFSEDRCFRLRIGRPKLVGAREPLVVPNAEVGIRP